MSEWLSHPAVQSGLAPFVVGLVVAELLNRLKLSGWAVVAGLTATAYLTHSLAFAPLTATRKLILATLIAAAVSPVLDFVSRDGRAIRYLLALAGGGVALWVFWPVLQQKELLDAFVWGGGVAFFVLWQVGTMDTLGGNSVRGGAAGLGLGMGTGGAALLGASALLGQFGLAIGAACGGYLLIQMLSGQKLPCGRTFTLATGLACGLIGAAAMLLAKLPWYCLPVLALTPLAAHVPVSERLPVWLQALLVSVFTLAVAGATIALTWRAAGPVPL